MDTDDDSPLFYSGSNARKNNNYSDSEDDTLLSSTLDHDGFEGLNVSDKIKNIMSIGNFSMDNTFDDENDALFEMPESLKNRETTTNNSVSNNKFMNFPFNKPESPPPAPERKKRASTKKPKEKKRKRDRGKKKEVQQELMEKTGNKERTTAFLKELAAAMDSSDDEEESDRLYKPKPRKSRKTRKQKSLPQMDENGEQLMRTPEFLGDTSSSEEDEKRMTKRDELEMYKESDRLRRAANLSIKPTFHKKSFNDFVSRLANKKSQTELKPSSLTPQFSNNSNNNKKQDSDDDLEIIGAPINLLSPDRTNPSAMQWSPVATSNSVHKKHNQEMRDRIAQYMYARRREMEEAAIARGEYRSAADRAKLLLQREKEAELIDLEVKRHFSKNKNNDQDESDGDYEEEEEEEGYNDDIMDELSGQEEEEEEEEENDDDDDDDDEHEENETNGLKSKSNDSNQRGKEEEEDEDDMATVAFKRWKRKAGKKSIFDDDDDEEVEKPKSVVAKKPEPKHSIANFFKNNEKPTVVESNVTEDKPLNRLKQRSESKEEDEQEEKEEQEVEKTGDNESMDIDKELDTSKQHAIFISAPKKPQKPKVKSAYVEEEAEEEDDEFFGAGGNEADETEDMDQFEEDGVLVERNEETDNIDEAVLRQRFIADQAEKDRNYEERLMKDITSGGLRRRKAATENGVMLDDFEFYDNEDDDLIAIRRAAAAKRRRMLLERGDLMEHLASDPKTAAFAKAAQTVLDEESRVYLSDSEEEEAETKYKSSTALVIEESEEEEDDDEEEEEASSSVPIVVVEKRMEVNEEEGLDFESNIQIQTMARSNASPLTSRDKPFFRSPGKMDRFKSLLAEGRISFGGSNDTGTHVGFGAPAKKDKGKEQVRGFVPIKNDKKSSKSRLLGIMASRADSFT